MNPMMKKLLEKKLEQGKELSDDESSAQMSVLKDLKGQMGGMMGDKMKKVSVMSDSQEGLKKGLSKAEDLVNNGQEDPGSRGILHDPEEEMEMHNDQAETPDEHKTPDELEQKIQELMSLKKSKEEQS